MHFQFLVAAPNVSYIPPATHTGTELTNHLLQQMIALQQEQIQILRTQAEANNNVNRWRNFLQRWSDEFPILGDACRAILPHLERAFLKGLDELTEKLMDESELENEYALSDYLERVAVRTSQLGALLHTVSQVAEASTTAQTCETTGGQ
jgi:hypothetical protein